MVAPRVCILLLGLLALTSFVATSTVDGNEVEDSNDAGQAPSSAPLAKDVVNNDELVDDDDEDGYGLDPDSKIEGIPLRDLTIGEIYQIADDRDEIDQSEWDILDGERQALERSKQGGRKKRWIAAAGRLLFSAGRALFRGSRAGRVTSSGSRITRQYSKLGNYKDAARDFDRFKPKDVKTFNGRISGRTGTFGNHRLTVRNGSKNNGPPTFEIRSPRPDGSTYVRKFRYHGRE